MQPGGSFALNPDGSLNNGQIKDFAQDGISQQHLWGVQLAQTYYGSAPSRNYWMGCSTGGRQGHILAQNFPNDYDGILAGANAYNWDRFIPAELYPQVVMNKVVGAPISAAKLNAVTNAAIAACDGQDRFVDGLIQDPRACTCSAKSFICTANGGLTYDPNCLTPIESTVVNKIWDGPRESRASMETGSNAPGMGSNVGRRSTSLAGTNPFRSRPITSGTGFIRTRASTGTR